MNIETRRATAKPFGTAVALLAFIAACTTLAQAAPPLAQAAPPEFPASEPARSPAPKSFAGDPPPSTSVGASASGLQAVLTLADTEGKSLPTAIAGEPFALDVLLLDASTGEPPRGLRFDAWIRPVAPGMASCGDAGRSFRATRRLPADAVDLAGPILAAVFDEGAVSLVDPRLDLASANAIAAWSFRMPPAGLVADTEGTRFLASFAQTDEIVAIDAIAARLSAVPGQHAAPGALIAAADAAVWVAQDGRGTLERIDRHGHVLVRHELVPPIALRDTPSNALLASGADGQHLLVDRETGKLLAEARGRAAGTIVSDGGRALGIAVASDGVLEVRWLDGGRQRIEIGAPADRVVAARDGRTVFALDRPAGMIAAVDLGVGQIVAVESFGEPIDAAEATARALFVRAADQSRVGVLSIAALGDPTQPSWRSVSLGPAVDVPESATAGDSGLIVLDPSPQVVALNAATGTASVIADYDAMGDAPPMSAVRIRGGRLQSATLLSRRFESSRPGRYHARTLMRYAGEHELVMTAGIGGLTLCLPFAVDGEGDAGRIARPRAELLAPADVRSSRQAQAELRLSRGDGSPWPAAEVPVSISALATGWRTQVLAQRIDGSRYALPLHLPAPGSYAILPAIAGFVPLSAMTVEVH